MKRGGTTKSRVNESGNYTQPAMRKRLFESIMAGGKGGKPGKWSARKAQMLAKKYKEAGGVGGAKPAPWGSSPMPLCKAGMGR
jgi:hypothetical protein